MTRSMMRRFTGMFSSKKSDGSKKGSFDATGADLSTGAVDKAQDADAEAAAAAAAATLAITGGGINSETREKVKKLSLQLAEGGDMNRAQAVETIRGLSADQAQAVMNAFAQQLDSQTPSIQAIACKVMANMGTLGGPHVVKISQLVLHDNQELRRAAANSLCMLGKTGIDALLRLRTHENKDVREVVAFEIGNCRIGQCASELAQMLDDPDVSVRGNVVNALMKLGEDGFVYTDRVANLLADDEVEVRRMVEGYLIQSVRTSTKRAAVCLKHKEAGCRLLGVKALIHAGAAGLQYINEVGKLCGDPDDKVDTAASEMVEKACTGDPATTVKLLQHPTSGARRIAVNAIPELGAGAAEHSDVMVKMLGDAEPRTRTAAVKAIGGLGEKGASHAGAIADLLTDVDGKVRAQAVEALINLGPAGQKQAGKVIPLLTDAEPDVKVNASKALSMWAQSMKAEGGLGGDKK
eukprot:TRINITY_DN68305_c0_g1_i1.p1 TRINITY_DN68305_c0_g1~~TRINITY_DN68305_c0_g1_i1.p1  ORF type:complete len:466 (+),score=121.87 TRINITY_DN68305_c0_g1_i1:80-1477(+)